MKVVRKVKRDNTRSFREMIVRIESIISQLVSNIYPELWGEPYINKVFLINLENMFNGKRISTPGNMIQAKWKLYELADDTEKKFGNIALVFDIHYHDKQEVQGTVVLETAVKDPDKNTFSSIKSGHIKSLGHNAPHSMLLLYDYDNITGMAFPAGVESVSGDYPHRWNNWVPFTHISVVPINLAVSLGIKNTGLYKVSLPFSYQILYRYFYGLDLDFNTVSIETVTGHRTDKGNPDYVAAVTVTHGGLEPDSEIHVDENIYREIK